MTGTYEDMLNMAVQELQDIAEMTDPDIEDSYINDDPHSCLESIAGRVREMLKKLGKPYEGGGFDD